MTTPKQNGFKWWNRRVGTAGIWAVLNFGMVLVQPLVNIDPTLVQLFIEKSTWIAGLLIIGLTGTDALGQYAGLKVGK